ncbi:MAG: hypothetical protein RM368_04670 [Nostoc sp. DedSLP03]|uniref:hypothetical protein n=1 Tax=Nostoc sp. DedSLP03 TaxID=3075400 RepID=UPI002AD2701C|nr:hypothetical protein [Nostoc sp. DedSLP03]MDZ7964255.1 hypothetical protein [Nostoc sp. DedSLP03]
MYDASACHYEDAAIFIVPVGDRQLAHRLNIHAGGLIEFSPVKQDCIYINLLLNIHAGGLIEFSLLL